MPTMTTTTPTPTPTILEQVVDSGLDWAVPGNTTGGFAIEDNDETPTKAQGCCRTCGATRSP